MLKIWGACPPGPLLATPMRLHFSTFSGLSMNTWKRLSNLKVLAKKQEYFVNMLFRRSHTKLQSTTQKGLIWWHT